MRRIVAQRNAMSHDMRHEVKARVPESLKSDVERVKRERVCSKSDIVRQALLDWLPRQPEISEEQEVMA